MAGLFDFATDPQSAMMTQMALGLLSAGGPSSRPVSLGQAIGQAGQQGMQGYRDAQNNQMNQMKLDELKKRMAFMQNMPDMKDPKFINQALQSGAIDLNTALPLMMKDNKNTWQDGGDKLIQLDAYGQPTGQSLPKGLAPSIHFVDQGGKVTPTLVQGGEFKTIGSLEKTASPDAILSRNTAIRGQNMSDARAREQFNFTKGQEGKPQLVDNQWVYKPTAQYPQGRVEMIPGIADKPLTESQGAATNFGMRSMKANEILTALEKDGSGQMGAIKRFITAATPGLGMGLDDSMGTMTNWTQSAKQQKSEQARLDFLTAVLRKESGASISPSEHITGQRQYFAQPNDSDEVLAQKQANRAIAIEGLKVQAGPGGKYIKPASNVPPQAVNDLKMRRSDPKAKAQFDEIFGAGAADRALGEN